MPTRKERGFRALFDHCLTPAGLVEEDGTFFAVNRAYCQLVHYSEAELVGMKFQQITETKDSEFDEEMTKRVARGDLDGYDMTKRYITKLNRIVWVHLRVDAVRDDDGKFLFFLAQCAKENGQRSLEPVPEVPREVALAIWIKRRWPVLVYILSGLAALIGYALKGGN